MDDGTITNYWPHSGEYGCIAYRGPVLAAGLPSEVQMGDNQRIVFAPPLQLDDFWRAELGNIQFEHLSKSSFAIELAVPEIGISSTRLSSRLWATTYAILLHGMPRLLAGLEVFGSKYSNGLATHRVVTPYRMYRCPHASTAEVTGNVLIRAAKVAAGLRSIRELGAGFLRLRSGFGAWVTAIRTEHGDARLHQFVRSIEAVIKPNQNKTGEQFVRRGALFCVNPDILDELYTLRSLTEHMNDYSSRVTGNPDRSLEIRGWFRSFQAELLAQTIYTRILSNEVLRNLFATDEEIDRFWAMDCDTRRSLWGNAVNLNELARTRFMA